MKLILILPLLLSVLSVGLSEKNDQPREPETVMNSTVAVQAAEKTAGRPVKLIVPKLKMNTKIEDVDLTDEKIVDTPADSVGWYIRGARPGETGTATLNGHFINKQLRPGIFYKLARLVPGDEIYIEDEWGHRFRFQVSEKELVAVEKFPLEKVYVKTDEARLNLITCAGSYNAKTDNYTQRTIVYTKLMK